MPDISEFLFLMSCRHLRKTGIFCVRLVLTVDADGVQIQGGKNKKKRQE